MMSSGKIIRICLADGFPTSTLVAVVNNRTGKVRVVPCAQLAYVAERPERECSGLCLLAGPDLKTLSLDLVHAGGTDDVLRRLKDVAVLDQSKDFWVRAGAHT